MRVHHYLKNGLIFLPVIFSGQLFQVEMMQKTVIGFFAFSLSSSAVYIFNDIHDFESDSRHEVKRNRPIASKEVSLRSAKYLAFLLLAAAAFLNYSASGRSFPAWIFIITYIVLNVFYSLGLKNVPLLDVAILVSGYLLRVLYGAEITAVAISKWLYLTVISMSFYLGLGKRRNELIKQGDTMRKVLQYYNHGFLDKNMYVFLGLTIAFYALWCVDPATIAAHSTDNIIWTVPLVMLICMKYSLNIENVSNEDPVDVLLSDKILLGLAFFYGICMMLIIYAK